MKMEKKMQNDCIINILNNTRTKKVKDNHVAVNRCQLNKQVQRIGNLKFYSHNK